VTEVTFTIPGNPMGKQRARTLKTGRSYTPKETVSYENLVKLIYSEIENKPYFEGPIGMFITAIFPIPKSVSKAKRAKMVSGEIRPTIKSDWDNIGKLVSDSLNGIAYHDDKQIVDGRVIKSYGYAPMVQVTIWEV
jgi:Holliday junction resolvase RusA-like endonuclease